MAEKKSTELVVTKNALTAMASRLQLDPETMKKTLRATAFKDCKTDEEFVAALIVANEYGLNPLTKQIYAFAAKQGGGVVPVVSTDGWTHLLVDHPNYKNHSFVYSDKMVTMKGAKPCPEWCEIHIEKKDGTVTIIREFLDEVFRELGYANPWQTHTKRFLRHKTKIQGTRETFGYGGVYDEDEAERIFEAELVEPSKTKPPTAEPPIKSPAQPPERPAAHAAADKQPPAPEAATQPASPAAQPESAPLTPADPEPGITSMSIAQAKAAILNDPHAEIPAIWGYIIQRTTRGAPGKAADAIVDFFICGDDKLQDTDSQIIISTWNGPDIPASKPGDLFAATKPKIQSLNGVWRGSSGKVDITLPF